MLGVLRRSSLLLLLKALTLYFSPNLLINFLVLHLILYMVVHTCIFKFQNCCFFEGAGNRKFTETDKKDLFLADWESYCIMKYFDLGNMPETWYTFCAICTFTQLYFIYSIYQHFSC